MRPLPAPTASSSTPSHSRGRSNGVVPPRPRHLREYERASQLAHQAGMGVNAGHDLDLDNLELFRTLPHLDEVSIGHAIVSRAVFVGLDRVVREYLDALAGAGEL